MSGKAVSPVRASEAKRQAASAFSGVPKEVSKEDADMFFSLLTLPPNARQREDFFRASGYLCDQHLSQSRLTATFTNFVGA
jgi:hypothetical protein